MPGMLVCLHHIDVAFTERHLQQHTSHSRPTLRQCASQQQQTEQGWRRFLDSHRVGHTRPLSTCLPDQVSHATAKQAHSRHLQSRPSRAPRLPPGSVSVSWAPFTAHHPPLNSQAATLAVLYRFVPIQQSARFKWLIVAKQVWIIYHPGGNHYTGVRYAGNAKQGPFFQPWRPG